MKLYICEKPSQARDIANVLGRTTRKENHLEGDGFCVSWCLGHLLEQAPPEHYCKNLKPWRMEVLPVVPNKWHLKEKGTTKKQLKALGELLKKSNHVVVATDADREGDVIGREVLDYFGYKGKTERLWLSALDNASIKKALSQIRTGDSTIPLYKAGLGRQRADWLIGMNLTMATSSLFGVMGQGVLSVGRVQTPTLKIVVDRDREIENFKSKDYYGLRAWFNHQEQSFYADWQVPEELGDEEGRCLKIEKVTEIQSIISGQTFLVTDFKQKKNKKSAPLCFSLSSLQKVASSKFGFGAKETLDIAQSLYEKHKATTYPRTDCGYLPMSQFEERRDVVSALRTIDPSLTELIKSCQPNFKSEVWNDKKITAHHAIIPTSNTKVELRNMSEKERKLYDLIRRTYLAQFLGHYEYESIAVTLVFCNQKFIGKSKSTLNPGWQQAIADFDEKEEKEEINVVPTLAKGEKVKEEKSDVLKKKTKPSPRFTEGSLITAMKSIAKWVEDTSLKKVLRETSGIGTEATRANIIETLINREFIKKDKKKLISTEKGRALIDLLPPSITNPAITALWEQQLEQIAEDSANLDDFIEEQVDSLSGFLNTLKEKALKEGRISAKTHKCPECDNTMIKRKGKKGYWWGCASYPKCKVTGFDNNGEPRIIKKEAQKGG